MYTTDDFHRSINFRENIDLEIGVSTNSIVKNKNLFVVCYFFRAVFANYNRTLILW